MHGSTRLHSIHLETSQQQKMRLSHKSGILKQLFYKIVLFGKVLKRQILRGELNKHDFARWPAV